MFDPFDDLRDANAEHCLRSLGGLRTLFAVPPQAFAAPFGASTDDLFLAVWLYFHDDALTLRTIWRACVQTIDCLNADELLQPYAGIQIAVETLNAQGDPEQRYLRLFAFTWAVTEGLKISTEQLRSLGSLQEKTALAGISGCWYRMVPEWE
jgi:hypothetical protein